MTHEMNTGNQTNKSRIKNPAPRQVFFEMYMEQIQSQKKANK